MSYRNRIIGHGEESPDQLAANPRNWRTHPHGQEQALEGVLREVGWVDTVLVNKRTGFVCDGHLRVAHAITKGEKSVPVTYVDLNEDEEALVLASLDPIASLAATDSVQLNELLSEIKTAEPALMRLLSDLSASSPNIANGNTTLDLSPEERLLVFEGGSQRQIMLLFSAEEYAGVIAQFGKVMARYHELETNVDVVKFLLAK